MSEFSDPIRDIMIKFCSIYVSVILLSEFSDPVRDIVIKFCSIYVSVILLCASSDPVRDIMIKAGDLGFNNGEYIFFHIDLFSR